jgi:2,3-bisphosphoglycerate-dependent phosphoglycerate mutase
MQDLLDGKNVLVSAHGNSLRAIIKALDNIADNDIADVEIATGHAVVYEFDENGNIVSRDKRKPLV